MQTVPALRSLALTLATLSLTLVAGCHVGVSFRGPGYDAERGAATLPPDTRVVVAITHGELSRGQRSSFRSELGAVLDGLPQRPGLIGYAVRAELFGSEVWTVSAWEDDRALDAFVRSTLHRRAIADGGIPPDTVRSVRVTLAAQELPLGWPRVEELYRQAHREEVSYR